MATDFWLIEWQDISGDADHCIKEVAVSASAAVSALGRILEGEIVTDALRIAADGTCPAEAERDAFLCLFEDADPVRVLADLDDPIEHECDDGTITVTRLRQD
jgi:hypothetical protein